MRPFEKVLRCGTELNDRKPNRGKQIDNKHGPQEHLLLKYVNITDVCFVSVEKTIIQQIQQLTLLSTTI